MDIFNTKIKLINYLDKVNDLKYIEDTAKSYKADNFNLKVTEFPLLKLHLLINFSLLAEIAGEFADMILNEPEEAKELLLSLIVDCIKVLTDWEINEKMIYLTLALDSFPDSPHLTLYVSSSKGLFNVKGILICRSTPSKYLISTVYKCKDEYCPGNKGERSFGIGTSEKCNFCNKEKIEITSEKISSDHVLATFMSPDCLNSRLSFQRCQGFTIDFTEKLYSQLELGIQYIILVKKEARHYIAWGIKAMLPESLIRAFKKYSPSPYPQSIVELCSTIREICGDSPWALVNCLASQVAIGCYPVSSFIHLKTGLLLSLASTQGSKCPTSVLALGDCGSIISAATRLSPRALMLTPNLWTSPSGQVSLDDQEAWLEAGPLLLSSYGVLYVGNMPKFGSNFLTQIKSAVDSELVTLQQKPGCCTVDPKILTYPLKSAVWMQWKCNQYSWQDMHQLRTLIDVFGMPYLSEIGCDDETICSTVIHVATGQGNYEEERIIGEDDFREFLGITSAQEVEISEEATSLIKKYFVASRRERPDGLPIKAVKVLTGMCEAHARLSLRNIAIYEDAVAAIFIYEESVTALFGKSVFPEAPIRNCNSVISTEVANQMDYTLVEFSGWLNSYINSNYSENNTQNSNRSMLMQ